MLKDTVTISDWEMVSGSKASLLAGVSSIKLNNMGLHYNNTHFLFSIYMDMAPGSLIEIVVILTTISKLYTHVPYEKTQYKKMKWDQTGPLCRKTSPGILRRPVQYTLSYTKLISGCTVHTKGIECIESLNIFLI